MYKILSKKINSITGAAFIIAVLGVISRILGVLRDRILAGQFGAGSDLDIYYAAFRIPDLVFNFVVFGAISAAFIPIFSGLLKHDNEGGFAENETAWNFLSNILNVFAMILIVICGLLFVFADPLVKLISPGFSIGQLESTALLTRIMFLSPILLGLSGIIGGVLQSFKRFLVYALAPIMYNLGIIIGALWLVDIFGLIGLAVGVVLGAVMHLMVQLPSVWRLGYKYKALFSLKNKKIKEVFTLMIPRVLGLVAVQVNLIVITIFGSFLAAGTITVFNLANNLQYFPIALVGISFAIAAFPVLSSQYARSDHEGFRKTLSESFRLILFLIIPLSTLFILFRVEIVRIVLGSGKFGLNDVLLTANTLGLFGVSLFAQSLLPLLARAYFARHNTWIPFLVGLFSAMINILLSWLLADSFGVLGLTLAFSFSSVINFLLLFTILRYQVGNIDDRGMLQALFRTMVATTVMVLSVVVLQDLVAKIIIVERGWILLLYLIVLGGIAGVVYVLVSFILKSKELLLLMAHLKLRKEYKSLKIKNEGIDKVE